MRILLLFILFLCAVVPSQAAAFPVLRAPASYTGSVEAEGRRYTVALRLKADHRFVLSEEINGKARTLTGKWVQADGGAILHLVNRNGLDKVLNVGGTGKLYSGVQAPFEKYRNVVLEQAPEAAFPYAIMGTLSLGASGAILTDSATGLPAPMTPDPQLDSLLSRGSPLFADMDVEEDGGFLRLVRIRSAVKEFPPLQENTPNLFLQQIMPFRWQLSFGGYSLQCAFKDGLLTATDGSLRVEIPYTLEGDRILFSPSPKSAAVWDAFGLSGAGSILKGSFVWDFYDKILLLQGDETDLCVLEKIG